MPGTAEAAASTADAGGGFVPNQLAMLVPTFDPAKKESAFERVSQIKGCLKVAPTVMLQSMMIF